MKRRKKRALEKGPFSSWEDFQKEKAEKAAKRKTAKRKSAKKK